MAAAITGGCLCGACRYATDAAPINIRACHCRLCQKATGAPLYARVLVPLDAVRIEGPVGWHHSSAALRRGFCTACGTTLFSERASANVIGLAIGSLDEPERYPPTEHIWTSSGLSWLTSADDLPHYPEGPPA
ncbi:GFA family protein [Sphingobium sp. B2D3B]|nr:GFA family protein [Sphingobium sp. B2D3B]